MWGDGDRTKRNGFGVKEGRFGLDVREVAHRGGAEALALLPREVVGAPSLRVRPTQLPLQ